MKSFEKRRQIDQGRLGEELVKPNRDVEKERLYQDSLERDMPGYGKAELGKTEPSACQLMLGFRMRISLN